MKIHEYQAKELLAACGVPVPPSRVADTPEQARQAARELGGRVVVKAQIHAGGRGKGGGVKLAATPDEAFDAAAKIIGMQLVTHQTGPEGRKVLRVLVEQAGDIARELYLGIVLDRARERPAVMVSTEGGVEIEKVAAATPEKILTEHGHPLMGLGAHQARKLAYGLGLEGKTAAAAAKVILGVYDAFVRYDCSLAEVNPLAVTGAGDVIALDAKINVDDNALDRQPQVAAYRDLNEEEPLEIEASEHSLNYIKLDGEVGCMVNGAGLAMATMDLIQLAGSSPANFLDVGGTASVERVAAAFRILMADPNVKAVLINIFGGIVRCDRVAGGVIEALKQVEVRVPVVVRLEGTNADLAAKMLSEADFEFIVADRGLADAARKVVQALGRPLP